MNIIKSSLINLKGHKLSVSVTLLWIIMGITSSNISKLYRKWY